MKKFTKLVNDREILRRTMTEIGGFVDKTISSGHGVHQYVNFLISSSVKLIAVGSMTCDICTILDSLNEELKSEIKHVNEVKVKDSNQEFKKKILEEIDMELAQKMKNILNQNVVAPLIKYGVNQCIDAAAVSFKGYLLNKKEKSISKEAANLESKWKTLQTKQGKTNEDDIEMINVEAKMLKIKATSKSPATVARLAKYDLPTTCVEYEAVAIYFGKTLVITHDGVEHTFGNTGEIIKMDLSNFHFDNSTDGQMIFTNDCFYKALKDKLGLDHTSEKLRNIVSNVILTEPSIHAMIADGYRKFFYDAGFYGGSK